ncbi:MAG: glycosyl transferase, group 1 [uncultured bacterium]|nr:MAG: glycosyl transferase, group 1 [uncultured bacterium]
MHIVIDARFYRSSTAGLGRYTRALIRELIKIDHVNQYTIIITPADEAEYDQQIKNLLSSRTRVKGNLKIKNFSKFIVPITHYTLAEQIKFVKVLNDLKPDLVHFTNFNHPILYRGKFVTTAHDLTVMLHPVGRMQKSLIRRIAFNKVMSHAVTASRKVIAISEATKKDLVKYLHTDPKKIQVIYEGVDSQYKPIANSQSLIANKYIITKPYILFVSQWRPHKGLSELIKAFGILKEKYKLPHQLVITGKPNNDFFDLLSAINHSPFVKDIIRPGFMPEEDLPALFNGASAFIFPSHYEGFGLPPLEAMACGTPVISSNVSCMPEILGDAAVYFDPNKPEDMAERINDILISDDKQQILVNKGFEQVKKYSWAKMARETLDVYKEVIK